MAIRWIPKGYQQITSVSAAVGLTVPAGSSWCIIEAETQAVRYRDDADPSATVGFLLAVGIPFYYYGKLSAIKFFEAAASAKISVVYYGD